MKIGELTQAVGLSRRQIRYYEELGLLTSSRDAANYRIYDQNSKERLETVKLLRELDFSLNDIRQILDYPQDERTQELIIKKSAEVEQDLAALSNRVQILRTVAHILAERGLSALNLAELIKECAYVHSKNERMLPVTDDKILMEIGVGLIPLVDAAKGGDLLDGIVYLRRSFLAEHGFAIPVVHIRDNTSLAEFEFAVNIDGKPVCGKAFDANCGQETREEILSMLAAALRDNASAFA